MFPSWGPMSTAHLQFSAKSPQEGVKNADPWHKARSEQNPVSESMFITDMCGGLSLSPFSLGTECSPFFSSLAADHSHNISHQGCHTRFGQIGPRNISVFLGNKASCICQLYFAFADRVVLHAAKAWVSVELPQWVRLFVHICDMCIIYEPEEGCIPNHDQNVSFHQLLAEVSASLQFEHWLY